MSSASDQLLSPPAPAPPRQQLHLGVLDLLRGFAALIVVLYHFSAEGLSRGGILAKFFSSTLENMFSWGHLGVEVFFVISGFVIPYSLWNSNYQTGHFGSYMLKRIVRICPPAYVIILLTLLQWFVVDFLIHHNSTRISTVSLGQLVSNLTFSIPFTNYSWFNGVFWTLAIEFQFYLILGFLFNYLFKVSSIHFIAINVALSLLGFLPGLPRATIFVFNPLFAMGGLTLLFGKDRIKLPGYILGLLVFSLLTWLNVSFIAAFFGLGTALIIAFIKIQHSTFAFFGKISYSVYLVHFLTGSTFEFILSKLFAPKTEFGNFLVIFLCIALTYVSAYYYYIIIEKSFLQVARRLKL